MRMRRFLLAIALVAALTVAAAPLTPDEALGAALDCSQMKKARRTERSEWTLSWSGTEKGVYMFSGEKTGFVLVSGDSDAPPLLGYSVDGAFDPASIPPALHEYLTALDAAVSAGRKMPLPVHRERRADIAPLVKTRWNQRYPYNVLTPVIKGEHALTGCVATANAQILRYWESPTNPQGEISYTWSGGGQKLTYDFSKVSFDWENMLDEYGDGATETQIEAVSTLMYACGMAAKMNYSDTFSGATDIDSGLGMVNHFGYNPGMELRFRDFYRIDEWVGMLHDELSAGCPVPYYGFSPVGGHAFICDGYQGSDGHYFHINWGWGGLSDGYFLINALDPEYIGAGGTAGGFNVMQSAFFGMRPADSEPAETCRQILFFGYFAAGDADYKPGDKVLFGCAGGVRRAGVYNMSLETLRVTPGLKFTPLSGGDPVYCGASSASRLAPGDVIETYNVSSDNFPGKGSYRVTPAYRLEDYDAPGQWHDMPEETQMHTSMQIEITNDKININTSDGSDRLVIDRFTIGSNTFKNGEKVSIELSGVSENMDERMKLTPVLVDSQGYIVAMAESKVIEPEAGKRFEVCWDTTFDPDATPGSYRLGIINGKNMLVSETLNVVVLSENQENEFSVTNVRINRQLADSKQNVVQGETMSVSAKLALDKGYFEGAVAAWIFDADNNPLTPLADPKTATFAPGESQNISFKGDIAWLGPTATYGLGFMVKESGGGNEGVLIGDIWPFSAPDAAAVETVNDDEAAAEYYNLQGVRIAKPVKGTVAIMRKNGTTVKSVVK